MIRLLTFFVSVIGFAAVVWFGVTVELGERTLFGHLRAIGQSNEAQKLWDGTKEKVTDFVGIEAARRAEAAKAAFKNPGVVQVPAPEGEGAKAAAPAVERAPGVTANAPEKATEKPAVKAPTKPTVKPTVQAAAKPAARPQTRAPERAVHKTPAAPPATARSKAPAKPGVPPKALLRAQAPAPQPR